MRFNESKTIKHVPGSVNAKKEDVREIVGILLSLLVMAAFLVIAFAMLVSRAKDIGAMFTAMG